MYSLDVLSMLPKCSFCCSETFLTVSLFYFLIWNHFILSSTSHEYSSNLLEPSKKVTTRSHAYLNLYISILGDTKNKTKTLHKHETTKTPKSFTHTKREENVGGQ